MPISSEGVIINGFHDKQFLPVITKLLRRFNVRSAHIIYDEYKADIPDGCGVTFHTWEGLNWSANYAVDWNRLKPLDAELIDKMRDCEVVFLKMADRLESRRKYSYQERKNLYLKHLRYWNHILEKGDIDLFLSSNIPHETFDYVIFCLCKIKGVATLILYQSQINDTVLVMEDWKQPVINGAVTYNNLLSGYKNGGEVEANLPDRFRVDYELHTTIKNDPSPFYMANERPIKKVVTWLKSRMSKIKKDINYLKMPKLIRFIEALKQRIILRVRNQQLFSVYHKFAVKPDLSKKYLYFPLHYQPELTTCPLAGAFVEQILIAQMLSYLLPADTYLYVKEHPKQTSYGRSGELYKELIKLPQVRLIASDFSTYRLMENCISVVTSTGTAGWEALYRGKPVLMFGYNFYQYSKGVFPIKTVDDCQAALREVLNGRGQPTKKEIKLFLKSLEANTIEGYVDAYYRVISKIDPERNVENIYKALTQKIEKLICEK